MSVYLDASVLMSVFHDDDHSDRVTEWLSLRDDFIFSLWTVAEVSSALSRQVKMKNLSSRERERTETRLDLWLAGRPMADVASDDFDLARRLLRADVRLRTPDALHIAVAVRQGLELATLDRAMAESALDFGLGVIVP